MRLSLAVFALSFSIALTGCMSSLRIRDASLDLKNPKGLPFYAKVGACKQQSVWLEYRYEISADRFGPVLLNQQDYEKVSDAVSQASTAEQLGAAFKNKKLSAISPFVSDDDPTNFDEAVKVRNLVLGANTGELTAIVDYSHPMWLNSARPLAGTTQVSGKFGADGTLTEASAQLDDETLSTILTAVSSITSAALAKLAGDPTKPFQTSLKVSARIHTHTMISLMNAKNDEGVVSLPTALTNCGASFKPIKGGSWTITDAARPADGPKKKDADKESDKPDPKKTE